MLCKLVFWPLAVGLAAAHHYASRHGMSPDGISYLELGDAFARGDWRAAINGSWSPLQPFLLGGAFRIAHPTPYWEFAVYHVVGFVIFLGALLCFDFFLATSFRYYQRRERVSDGCATMMPEWLWFALGYTLFIWSASRMLFHVARIAANVFAGDGGTDTLAAAFIYLATALALRLRERDGLGQYCLLGIALGLGYLGHNYALALALPILLAALPRSLGWRNISMRAAATLLTLVITIAPYVIGLSIVKGRLTLGDGATLEYAFHVDGVPYTHWRGGLPASGSPKHPERVLYTHPPVYEFATPIGGTYPLWYDFSYWYEGIKPRFDWHSQWHASRAILAQYAGTFYFRTGPLVAAALALTLFAHLSGAGWGAIRGLQDSWPFWLVGGAGLASFVWVDFAPQRIVPFVIMLWLGIFGAMKFTREEVTVRAITSVVSASLILLMVSAGHQAVKQGVDIVRGGSAGMFLTGHPQWEVASELRRIGVGQGDRVAVIGPGFNEFWARLARVKIVAEIPDEGVLWQMKPEDVRRVITTLARSGAKVAVAREVPSGQRPNWIAIGNTGYFAWVLTKTAE